MAKNFFGRLTPKHRKRAREIARDCWIESGGNVDTAKKLAREKVTQEFGSIVIMITVAAAVIQICYYLFKFWQDTRCVIPPVHATEFEPK